MKIFYSLFLILMIASCNNNKQKKESTKKINAPKVFIENNDLEHMKVHEQMDLTSKEYSKFMDTLVNMYLKSVHKPKMMLLKADLLYEKNKQEKNPLILPVKENIASKLNYFKGEIYYKMGNYEESINVLSKEKYIIGNVACAIAANYIKLNQNEIAKKFIDKIDHDFEYFALGNYYESTGNKAEALKIYEYIKFNKLHKPFVYYKLAIKKIRAIKSNNILIREIYFPPGNPNFKTQIDDSKIERKIFDTLFSLPEVSGKKAWTYESPLTSDSDHYWIMFGDGDLFHRSKNDLNFFVYTKPFTIKFYNPKNKKEYSLSEWRKNKKN